MRQLRPLLTAILFLAGVPVLAASPVAPAAPANREAVWRHRNLGKAFYENPSTQHLAPAELEKALELAPESVRERINFGLALLRSGKTEEGIAQLQKAQEGDPTVPHTWFNLGISFKKQSRYDEALRQLEGMAERVPDEPITRYNLGVLHKLEGEAEQARVAFERAAQLAPDLAGPHFQLASLYRQAGEAEAAEQALARFKAAKQLQAEAALPEDLEWSWYSELLDEIEPQAASPGEPAALVFETSRWGDGFTGPATGLALLDADGDGGTDLLAWSRSRVRLFDGSGTARKSGLDELTAVASIAVGDFDNDGLPDLCVLQEGEAAGPHLYRNQGGGAFSSVAGALPARPFDLALWLDVDHDYDLDLLLFGAEPALLRNQGAAGWVERTEGFPFVAGKAVAAASFDLLPDSQGTDLVVAYLDRSAALYRDHLGGRYAAAPLTHLAAGPLQVLAWDLDADGWTDLVVRRNASAAGSWLRNRRGELGGEEPLTEEGEGSNHTGLAIADLEARGFPDVVLSGRVLRNVGRGEVVPRPGPKELAKVTALAAADFDGDGREDLVAITTSGELLALRNRTETPGGWVRIGLRGVKNLRLAAGAEIEVKAGSSYQKRLFRGTPLTFGLGDRTTVDTVRITWPNGLIQNETGLASGGGSIFEEAPRLSGSCPMIFTWDGEGFRFITDVLGVAPLGATAGDGNYFPVDHDEVIQIAGEALVARHGQLEVRITEELREVAFLDQVRLLVVDHPAATGLFVSDKFSSPPFPQHRSYTTGPLWRPTGAWDDRGNDVTELVAAKDGRYPDSFERDVAGVGELHSLEVELPGVAVGGPPLLVLSGWVDWADGSTFLAASQVDPAGLLLPTLEVRLPDGKWRMLSGDLGIPAGKPKTIVLELPDDLPPGPLRFRIITNLCVYWDEIALAADLGDATTRTSEAALADAELRFRGFSRPIIHPQRKQPERFVYADVRPTSMWNPTPGLYTRYGDVRPLLATVDDLLLVMGSGDEVRLLFDAAGLPPLPASMRRDYLLWVDGWAKDGDANTAFSQTVEPLPFHGMPQYPYEAPQGFPDDPAHRRWREVYQTRPALRLVRPLPDATSAAVSARP